jgi:inorganic triphosphatase YgiF
MADGNKGSLKLNFSKYSLEPETKFLTNKATVDAMIADIKASPYLYAPIERDERTNIYYDTNGFRLYRMGFECRGRKFGDKEFRHDLKTPEEAEDGPIGPDKNGIFLRREYNRVSSASTPDLKEFSELGLGDALEDIEDKNLKAWVKGYFTRQRVVFKPAPDTEVEIAFENGYYQTMNNSHKSDEMWIVELELKKGNDLQVLVDTANKLKQQYGLKVCVKTKGEMGLEFARQFMYTEHQGKFDKSTAERSSLYTPLRRALG